VPSVWWEGSGHPEEIATGELRFSVTGWSLEESLAMGCGARGSEMNPRHLWDKRGSSLRGPAHTNRAEEKAGSLHSE
jgi:hypothetical protein